MENKKGNRLLYVFPKSRKNIISNFKLGLYPNYALYGYPIIEKYGWECSYIDSEFKRSRLHYFYLFLHLLFVKLSGGIGFSIESCITNLKKIKRSDLVFATSDSVALPILFLKYLKLINSPIVYLSIGLSHCMQNKGKHYIANVLGKIINKADAVIFASESEKIDFGMMFKIPESKLFYLSHPAAVDKKFFNKIAQTNNNNDYILVVGRDKQRDYETLFKAISSLNISCKVVTSSNNIKGMLIPKNAELFIDIDFLKLIELYKNASLVVMPLYENNYSAGFTVLFQANAMVKAVILSHVSAIKKSPHFKDMENCILVPSGNAEKLESAIKYLHQNVKTREKIGNNARELIKNNYSLEQFIIQLNNLFKDILDTKRN